MLTNQGTEFDEDGWADALSDIRRLYLLVSGGANDLNGSTVEANQETANASSVLSADDVQAMIDASIVASKPLTFAADSIGGTQVLTGALDVVTLSTVRIDSASCWNSAANFFAVPATGIYQVCFRGVGIDGTTAFGASTILYLYVGSNQRAFSETGHSSASSSFLMTGAMCINSYFSFNAGDLLRFYAQGTVGNYVYDASVFIVKFVS